jgi:hypothetical protein
MPQFHQLLQALVVIWHQWKGTQEELAQTLMTLQSFEG